MPTARGGTRAAVGGLLLLAGFAWAFPEAQRLWGRVAAEPAPVVYSRGGSPSCLLWSPRGALRSPKRSEGQVLDAAGSPARPVGGWQGLLLGTPLDLNGATVEDLIALPGVGPKTAAAISEARSQVGRFGRIEDLLAVPGLGPGTLERLRPLVRVGGAETCGD